MAIGQGTVLQCNDAADFEANLSELRKKIFYALGNECGLPIGVAGWAAKRFFDEIGENNRRKKLEQENKRQQQAETFYIKSMMALITCHGDFGVSELTANPPITYTVALLEKWCRRQPAIVSAWDAVCNKLFSVKSRYKLQGLAFALEVCTRTWMQEHKLKLHMHIWILQARTKQRLPLSELKFDNGCHPFVSGCYGRDSRGVAAYSGCYYVCCVKIGQVFKYTSAEPHVDFAVKPDWVIRMYAADKITVESARDELVRQVSRAADYLEQLKFHEQYREQRDEELARQRVLAAVMASAKPPRHPPGIHSWSDQWHGQVMLDRYKFLVLESPTRMGKTRYVQTALVDSPEQALILDCADAIIPALKGNYIRSKHSLIMYDEAHAEMIIRCKKLFQASMNPVTYGSSPTNAYVHTVWLHGVKMVIGSNCWAEEVSKLPETDRDWIEKNSVYIYVDSPLWVE